MKSIIIQNKQAITFKCRGQQDAYHKASLYCDITKPFKQFLVNRKGHANYIGGNVSEEVAI